MNLNIRLAKCVWSVMGLEEKSKCTNFLSWNAVDNEFLYENDSTFLRSDADIKWHQIFLLISAAIDVRGMEQLVVIIAMEKDNSSTTWNSQSPGNLVWCTMVQNRKKKQNK